MSDVATHQFECMTIGHQWEAINPPAAKRGTLAMVGNQLVFRCVRCGKERHEVWSRRGILMSRRYIDPSDWVKIGKTAIERRRLELLSRWG